MHDKDTRQAGFTLIELSIVLVIIGLLVGGILQGQEMINNTRIKTTVAQTDSIQAAVQTFEDKFQALPGDFRGAGRIGGTSVSGGSANGLIENGSDGEVALNAAVSAGSEMAVAFNQLAAANLLQGITENGADGTLLSTMQTRISNGNFDIATFDFSQGPAVGVRLRGTNGGDALLTTADAFGLDTKYDDGNPSEGRWQAENGGSNTCITAGGEGGASEYSVNTSVECILVISIR